MSSLVAMQSGLVLEQSCFYVMMTCNVVPATTMTLSKLMELASTFQPMTVACNFFMHV